MYVYVYMYDSAHAVIFGIVQEKGWLLLHIFLLLLYLPPTHIIQYKFHIVVIIVVIAATYRI